MTVAGPSMTLEQVEPLWLPPQVRALVAELERGERSRGERARGVLPPAAASTLLCAVVRALGCERSVRP